MDKLKLSFKSCGETVKRVDSSFRTEVEEIRIQIKSVQEKKRLRGRKILSDAEITKLIVKHNSWPIIKKEIILFGIYGEDWKEFINEE